MPRKTATPPKQPQQATTAARLRSVVKSCRDIMRKDKGLNGDLDRLPMLTWIMFLKFLDDMERVREDEAELEGTPFRRAIEPPYRWRDWNAPNSSGPTNDGRHNSMTGDALTAFINQDEAVRPDGTRGPGLFAYLRGLAGSGGAVERRDVVASVFRGTVNRLQSGYILRDVLDKVSEIHFSSSEETHTLSQLYESMLKEMRDAAGDSGEFYTPRPLVRMIVKAVDPKPGELILDPAAGTGGFLLESYEHLMPQCKTVQELDFLQRGALLGIEAKSLPYLLCQMNLLLHGLESPQIDPLNALRFKMSEIGDRDRVDVVVTNPPFGGEEERGIQRNFPDDMQTSETALLFLQLIMRKLRRPGHGGDGGRAGVVVPSGILSADGVAARIKDELLNNFNLHTIVRLPNGVFAPYTPIPTNVLFFARSGPTDEIWYYEHPLPEERKNNYTKTRPLQFEEFEPLFAWWRDRKESDTSWLVKADAIRANGCNLDVKNPRAPERLEHLPPEELVKSVLVKERRISALVEELAALINGGA
jgi:type I restriction enzyme M protein